MWRASHMVFFLLSFGEGIMGRKRARDIRIGISGWTYPPWRGVFYPKGLAQKKELAYASRAVDTIEINGSFYSLVRPSSVQKWCDETPDGFVFSVKGSRYVTHLKRLTNIETPLANFFASGILAFGEKLGPILWQLPPNMPFNPEKLDSFLSLLPHTMQEAAALAKKHDVRVAGRSFVRAKYDGPIHYALEVRHPSYETPSFLRLLRRHQIAVCVADTAGKYPEFYEPTAEVVYVRLHGDKKLYESGYSRKALFRWASLIGEWQKRHDVYVYFDNDAKVRAPFDARSLRAILRGEAVQKLPNKLVTLTKENENDSATPEQA